MKNILIIAAAAVLFIFAGCDTYEDEYNASQQRISRLELSIDSLKNTPAFLYGDAHDKINNKQYDEAKEILYRLNREHPAWNQKMVIESITYVQELQRPGANITGRQESRQESGQDTLNR